MADVDVSCLCGKFRSTVHLKDSVPVPAYLCHQNQCRWNLGALCHDVLELSNEARPAGVELLEAYTIPGTNIVRFFCGTCGSHILEGDRAWKVQTGVVERIHSEQVFGTLEEIAGHRHVHDTKDGGLSACLNGSKRDFPKGLEGVTELPPSDQLQEIFASSSFGTLQATARRDTLSARCACGGVQFFLTRPDASSAKVSSPWPDLIVRYCERSPENPDDEKWWIRDGSTRWLAGTCACRSCRLGLGSPIQAWAFVSKSSIFHADGTPLTYELGTLRSFESSPGVIREFCGTCGATIFWHNRERPGVVDVSVGVLRAEEGALARSWLQWWTKRVSFAEEAFDKKLIQRLEAELHHLQDGP